MVKDSRSAAVRTLAQTNQIQSDPKNRQLAQGLVGIGLTIVYLADQVGELVKAIKEQQRQPQINVEIQNPGGTDENHSGRESKGRDG